MGLSQILGVVVPSIFSFLLVVIVAFSPFILQAAEPTTSAPPIKVEAVPSPTPEEKSMLDKAGEMAKNAADKVNKTLAETRERREQAKYFALLNYSPADLLIPSKYGITVGYIKNADKTWEFEYLRGTVSVPFLVEDLGSMTDQRFSIIKRKYYGGNSFNFSYGLSYFEFDIHLGDDVMNRVSGGSYPSIDVISVQSLGFNMAVGNRWTFKKNFTVSLDWISWAQPVFVLNEDSDYLDQATDEEDREDVNDAIKFISYFPRFAFFKFQIGYLF